LAAEDDPLLVIDLLTVKQRCSPITVAFDDGAVADLVDELVDRGIRPERFTRLWIHTHPGDCPRPSMVDEATFGRVFGPTDWSVMAIVARSGATYARLSFHVGPGGALEIPIEVDYGRPFDGADWDAWNAEYAAHIVVADWPATVAASRRDSLPHFVPPELWEEEDFYGPISGSV